MVTQSEKRAAELAVIRFGADPHRVKQTWQVILRTRAQGQATDVLAALVADNLLTPDQAGLLRLDLQNTHFDATEQTPSPPPLALKGAKEPPPKPAAQPLRHLGGYRLLRQLGEGGMGSVYLGYQEGVDRAVAIKVLAEHMAVNPAYLDRFRREAASGLSLNHPNIVHCLAAGQDRTAGKHYLVLEFVDGPSAHELLQRYGRLPVGDAVPIALDIAKALEYIHSRNFVHRDIKPDNILLTKSGLAKLADLGLAKCRDEASPLTVMRQGFGTPFYMPYEQAVNARRVDGRSDIFALGATLYHLVTGEVPFPGDSPMEVAEKKSAGLYPPAHSHNPEVPELLDKILAKMLARDPDNRYQTASQLIVDLERTNLAAPVPSFVDPNLALRDPLVRERLIAPPQPTQPDLEARPPAPVNSNPDTWYLRFRGNDGKWCKTKATTQEVVQRLLAGKVPEEVEGCRQSKGDFKPLVEFPEFEEAVAASASPREKHAQRPPKKLKVRQSVQAQEELEPTVLFGPYLWCGLVVMGLLIVATALLALAD